MCGSCISRKEVIEWDNMVFPNLNRVLEVTENDTTYLGFHDDSWFWDPEYVDYRINYILWRNKERINTTNPIKVIVFHLDGEGDTLSIILGTSQIKAIFDAFDYNSRFQKVSEYFLKEFTPTEALTLRNANQAIGEYKNDSLGFTEMLFELSKNSDTCLVYDRVKLIIEMVNTTGMRDFFDKRKISGESFVEKMNVLLELSNQQIVEIYKGITVPNIR